MASLDHVVLKYMQSQGYLTTARIFRRDAAAGKDDIPVPVELRDIYDSYQEDPTRAREIAEKQRANAPAEVSLTSLRGKRSAGDLASASVGPAVPPPPQNLDECDRVFLGNLHFKVTQEVLAEAFADCGVMTDVQWVTDKETGNFYGTAFATFETPAGAALAAKANGRKVLNRPIKVNLAPHKKQQPQGERRAMPPAPKVAEQPQGCKTLFLGNLNFSVTEDDVKAFFKNCGEISGVRFQLRENGEFKGCGYVEFESEYALPSAIKLHAKPLKGRPVRLDFA